jgi:hypothetical protein
VPDTLATLAQYVSGTLTPLTDALGGADGRLLDYFRKLGWVLPEVPSALQDVRTSGEEMVRALARLERAIRREDEGADAADAIETAASFLLALARFSQAVRALPQGLRTQLPAAFVEASHIADELLTRLFDDALSRQLERESRGAFAFAQALGLIETAARTADPARFQPDYEQRTIRWDRFALLGNGLGALMRDVYGWGTPAFDGRKLFLALRDMSFMLLSPAYLDFASRTLLESIVPGLPHTAPREPGLLMPLFLDSPLELVVSCFTLPKRTAAEQQGVVFTLAGLGAITKSFDVTPSLKLEIDSQIDLASGLGLAVWPDRAPKVIGSALQGTPSPVASGRAALRLKYAPPDPNDRVSLLRFDELLIEARGAAIEAALETAPNQPADLRLQATIPGLHLQLGGLGQDSFLSELLPEALTLDLDVAVGWSMNDGLTWKNASGPNISIPVATTVGPVTLKSLDVDLRSSGSSFRAGVGLTASAKIGPVSAQVQGVGFAIAVDTQGGNFGSFDLSAALKPPSGIGLSVDAQGVVTGGGFLFHDADNGLYAGAMQLSLRDQLTLKAFGLISTRMPDGSRGYSLIVFITAEDFRPIPLGLGFTLLGIGGMVGVNRTFDEKALREGLKNGTLATLLFPRDPVGNAPTLIRNLATAFPARRSSYLLGIVAKIGWFTPTLITMDLALIFEFGSRERLLALGRISAALPSPDNDLVRLNMEAMGVLDFDAGTAAVDAVLVDSRLAHKFPITGSAALRAGFGDGPSFLLSIGGFNPHFAPPAGVPELQRVAIALSSGDNPRLVCDAYFAITSNTVQFGAHASLYASAAGFSVEGFVGFDVLIQIAPLHFLAEFEARLQLKRGSHNLFGVKLAGALEGPRPLRVSGKATFSILWWDYSVHFDATLVKGERPPLPPAVNVLAQLTQALTSSSSWSTQRSATQTHGVALRSLPPASTTGPIVLDPLGQLTVKQQVVPLNTSRDIDTFGGAPVAGRRRFALTASIAGTPLQSAPVQAPFASAQFFAMTDDEKLAAPSSQPMDAGCMFGSAQVAFDATQVVPAPLEYQIIRITLQGSTSTAPPAAAPAPYTMSVDHLQTFTRCGAAARAPVRRVGRARFRNDAVESGARLNAPRWAILRRGDGPAATVGPGVRSYSEYQAAVKELNRTGARWQLVPEYELDT